MKNYRVKLPAYTMVGPKVISFDHWVTVRANDEREAKIKASAKIAFQLQHEEPIFIFTDLKVDEIRNSIDITDLEVYEA